MSPRSLLFSSNEERSRPLIQALQELELEVEHCRVIFDAIERLTSRKFDVIVADWDEGPEARFLLKTSRELKLNKTAFALAVASDAVKVAAKEAGADLCFTKPLHPDQIKYALLTCDQFLAHLKVWLARDFARPSEARAHGTISECLPPSHEQSAHTEMAAPPARPSPAPPPDFNETTGPLNLTFASLDEDLFRSRRFAKGWKNSGPRASSHGRRGLGWRRYLRIPVVVVAFFCLGYALSQPFQFHDGFTSVKTVYQRATEAGRKWAGAHKSTDSAVVAEADALQPMKFEDLLHPAGRAIPGRYSSTLGGGAATSSEGLAAQAQPDQGPASVGALYPRIPGSLELPGSEAVHHFPARFGASLLGELEPVNLSEELSAGLLLEKVQPSYPEQALRAGLQGSVVLQAWIRRDGTIRELKLVEGYLLLGQAAYNAVKQWRYKPYLRNGDAVEAQTYITIDFRLPQQSKLSTYPR